MVTRTSVVRACLTVAFISSIANQAEACLRCGRGFGRSCAFVQKKQVVVKKQAASYAYQQPSNTTNLSLINVYPAASSTYGVSQLYQAYQPNPDLAVTLSSRVAENAIGSLNAAVKYSQQAAEASVELQRLQLATMHLQAAMGTSNQEQRIGSLSLEVRQGAGSASGQDPQGMDTRPGSLLSQKCAQCHGQSLQAPKAGLYLDEGISLDATQAMRAMQVLNGHDVPEPMHELISGLTERERCDLMAEITQLWRR